jgi:hypothetical protein
VGSPYSVGVSSRYHAGSVKTGTPIRSYLLPQGHRACFELDKVTPYRSHESLGIALLSRGHSLRSGGDHLGKGRQSLYRLIMNDPATAVVVFLVFSHSLVLLHVHFAVGEFAGGFPMTEHDVKHPAVECED